MKILKSKAVEVVEGPELKPKVDKPESVSEVVAELVPLQEEIFSPSTEVE